ncbi:MAG: glycoside hydrolase family 31 protein [Bacteroidaceae bacterium]
MKHRIVILCLALCSCLSGALAQEKYTSVIVPLKNERWWGGLVALGHQMPFGNTLGMQDMARNNLNNQVVPFMLSSEGRYLWAENPFRFEIKEGQLFIYSNTEKLTPIVAGTNLKEAFLAASAKHFPPSGKLPEADFFSLPQYNTWIELMYNQNQADILNYAHRAVENGFPKGVFMVDDNWQKYYGNFDFKPEKFPDARAMTDELHRMGFKVMLWVAPYVSADSPEFRLLEQKGYLLKQKGSDATALIHWWNGYSACYDVTNPAAMDYLKQQLRENQSKYGIDGFKFDGGDVGYMNGEYNFFEKDANVNRFMEKWAEIGLSFPYNELRASWKLGGQALVQRLGDKGYSWDATKLLIPDMTAAGLLGYAYTCPDMIGGGQFSAFLNVKKFDEELIVRSCQVHALMPMMQFSVAPWRILSEENIAICAKFAKLHQQMGNYILEVAKKSSQTGEPIVRHMEYAYPHQGFIECKDQFMLGERYLVAPMVTPGTSRTVTLPKGKWMDDLGNTFRGPKTIKIEVPLNRLAYYRLLTPSK